MNHLKNQGKFEQKLKEQFDNFEAKPNEALWENIAQNLPTDNFENTIAEKLSNLHVEPNESVWLAIENRLPIVASQNNKLIYLWVFAMLTFGIVAAFVANNFIYSSKTATLNLEGKGKNITMNRAAISNKQLAPSTMQKVPSTLQIAASTMQKARTTMQKVSSTMQKVSSTMQKVSSTMQKAPIAVQIVQNTEKIAASNLDLPLKNNLPIIENNLPIKEKEPAIISQLLVGMNKDSVVDILPINKIDSVNSPKVITVNKQSASKKNYTGVTLKNEKLSIIAYAGLGYSFMRYELGNDKINGATNRSLREKTESSAAEITGGFLIGYDLTKRFTISSGLILANFKQTMNFSKEIAKNPIGNYEENMIYNSDTITIGNNYSTTLKYSFTEIPLFITYKVIENQKLELAFQTGLGIGFVTGVNTYIINSNNIGVYSVTNKNDFPAFKNTLFFSFQPQLTYNLNSPGVSVGFMPIIKTSLTNIVSDENWLKQYPYNVSMNLFLRKRF